ncbi:hypothetical protein BAZSYMA_ACONTIG155566_0 [Bathymodiolus azoricus thioautotrophic gill symbiont]|uniref:Uncharacterized protein n=1 Tax=Bathymodiolus azoricus thioautotrophic gill symbiont TaxID=235205 RepID=A0A1H6JJX4_9GAMM|nr:hypothetical protein BAZSYMA_ACONTIG155566_0 [Bathymodiolus azoricus thioautotrophic gill symbiont]
MSGPSHKVGEWVMVFNATLTIFKLYRGGQFYWWRKPEYRRKPLNVALNTITLHYYEKKV